ncbi:hypothetical protein EDD86DRAFT_15308 [Gorgonomyces haynaldii]|nr:hypothetical protein EDD86DRAFT_15308 [Gorgonomyces haynaldii]
MALPEAKDRLLSSFFVSSQVLFWLRVIYLLFGWFVLLAALSSDAFEYFRYFTNWTWISINVYLTILVILTMVTRYIPDYDTSRYNRPLEILYGCAMSCSIIVSLVFWALLFSDNRKKDTFKLMLFIVPHACNLVYMVSEGLLSKVSIKIRDFYWPSLCTILYGILAYITMAFGARAPYPFLVTLLEKWWYMAIGIVGFIVLSTASYLVTYGIIFLRNRLALCIHGRYAGKVIRTESVPKSEQGLIDQAKSAEKK